MCETCNKGIPITNETELTKAIRLAQIEAKADKKTFVVIEDNGVYYPECLECRNKSEVHHGKIVAYIE